MLGRTRLDVAMTFDGADLLPQYQSRDFDKGEEPDSSIIAHILASEIAEDASLKQTSVIRHGEDSPKTHLE